MNQTDRTRLKLDVVRMKKRKKRRKEGRRCGGRGGSEGEKKKPTIRTKTLKKITIKRKKEQRKG